MDEMEIINLHKRCKKKVPQPKKASSKSDELKKAPKSPEFIDDSSEKEQKCKKADGKKVATKLKRSHSRKSPEFICSSKEEEKGPPKDDKGPPLLGVKGRSPKFF